MSDSVYRRLIARRSLKSLILRSLYLYTFWQCSSKNSLKNDMHFAFQCLQTKKQTKQMLRYILWNVKALNFSLTTFVNWMFLVWCYISKNIETIKMLIITSIQRPRWGWWNTPRWWSSQIRERWTSHLQNRKYFCILPVYIYMCVCVCLCVCLCVYCIYIIYTVKPVYRDRPRETQKVVFVDSWSLKQVWLYIYIYIYIYI